MLNGRLHLLRHGWPALDPRTPSTTWGLDPDRVHEVLELRDALPAQALWFSSPELKARQAAQLLTSTPVVIVDELAEQRRSGWLGDDLRAAVDRAFAAPDTAARPGWESLNECRVRVVSAVTRLREAHPRNDLVLAGHGTAWTCLLAELHGSAPDLQVLRGLSFPDHIVV